ncbi:MULTISPECIES: hypothetical protein [unclassified Micromonospora]|uniref:hypothetical protein n=1 Tax=unclassified Micromonospora TaxID=2617518 RepID=UPI00098D7286|nr:MULTISPECIES: hypothetical protein [unclassified Micromonospora]MDI5939882.1 hypothetical protein [Micromonospora sp. DH15]OON32136.1 hypothetical protein BSA16_07260 [Micromonospora sp. Rc5]
MTSPAEPASGDAAPASHPATPARRLTDPLRELIALALLGANAVLLFVGLIRLLAPADYSTFYSRAGSGFFSFAGLEAAVLPVLAVLLATHVAPVAQRAKLIVQVALGEYAFGALLAALTLLIWTVDRLAKAEVLDAFLGLLTRAAWLAIFASGAFVVFRVWRALYFTPKPKPAPGMYGQPQPGWPQQPGQPGQGGPQGWGPGQQGGWPSAGQQPGYPVAGQQAGYPSAGQPGGFPASAPPASAPPASAPPYPAPPQSGSPFTPPQAGAQPASPFPPPQPMAPAAPPFGQPPSADPTQAIPRQPGEPGASGGERNSDADRTQRFPRED